MNLYFQRHGQSETNAAGLLGGRLDKPLTEKGMSQAEAAIDAVAELNPDVIYCSPLLRAHKTAQIISNALGREDELIVDERLVERGAGVLEGTDDKGGQQLVSCLKDEVEGAEKFEELKARAQSFLDDLENDAADKKVLIIGHGAHIKMMIHILTGEEWLKLCNRVLPNGVPFQKIDEVA